MSHVPDDAWKRVAEAIRERRIEVGLSQAQLAATAETSESTVRVLETARRDSYHPGTLRGVSQALGWEPDAINRILRGDDPVEATSRGPVPDQQAIHSKLDELEAEIAKLRKALSEQGSAG